MAKFNSDLFAKGIQNRREPYYVQDDEALDLSHFYIPQHYQETLKSLLVPGGMIMDRIEKLAYDISQDYEGETIHMLCVLKGGSTFFGDLSQALRRFHDYARLSYIPYTFDFVRVKSYEGTESTGKVDIQGVDVSQLAGKHVLFVEDIIDTGLTMSSLLTYLNDQIKPASVRVASLVEKRTTRGCGFKADYVGFSIPDVFVVGYCLDYNECFRDLNHLAVINQVGMERFRNHTF
jgi:hypoxanthine phosphoribosyltransferase